MKILICGLIIGFLILFFIPCSQGILPLGQLETGAKISFIKNSVGGWDIGVSEDAPSIKMQVKSANRSWLTWAPVNPLHGITGLEEFDADLLKQLCQGI